MNKEVKWGVLIVIAIALIIAFIVMGNSDKAVEELDQVDMEMMEKEEAREESSSASSASQPNNSNSSSNNQAPAATGPVASYHTITYTPSGFNIPYLEVGSGSSITFVNEGVGGLRLVEASGKLVQEEMARQRESVTFVLTTPGVYSYHNVFDASHSGTIVVK